MQTQYINEMLDLPELEIHQILSIDAGEVHIEAVPLGDKQCCPCCGSGPGFDSNHLKVGTHPGAVDNKNAYVTQVFGLFHKH